MRAPRDTPDSGDALAYLAQLSRDAAVSIGAMHRAIAALAGGEDRLQVLVEIYERHQRDRLRRTQIRSVPAVVVVVDGRRAAQDRHPEEAPGWMV